MSSTTPPRFPHPRAGLAAIAALATAALLLTGCGDARVAGGTGGAEVPDSTTAPAAAPARRVDPAPVPGVPDGFPLAAGLPATNGDGTPVEVTDTPSWTDVELCGTTAWSQEVPVATTDLAGASYTGEAEDSRSRVVATYADESGAERALDALRDAYAACPDEEAGGTAQVHDVVEAQADSVTITHRYRGEGGFDTGLEVIQVVTVGNALFLGSYYGESGASAAAIRSAIGFAETSSRPVWRAMAIFAEPASTPGDGDLASFPIAAGWPPLAEPGQGGVFVPVTDSEPDVERDFGTWACGTPAPEASGEVLRARYANVVDHRARRLVVLDDADQAVAFVASLRDFYGACPEVTDDNGSSYPVVLRDTEVGGQSFGLVRFSESKGSPMTGLMALHVVRVGRSVLLDAVSNEGGAGPEGRPTAAREQLTRMAAEAADLVAAQCAFTEAGC